MACIVSIEDKTQSIGGFCTVSLLETNISKLQKELGIPVYLLGYELFFDAIGIYTTDYHLPICKGVYIELAQRYKLTPKQVEARINGVLRWIWNNKNLSKYGISGLGKCPTPKHFLITFAVYINEKSEE